jgi:uncharacterized protein YdeI (YjbR/CyaY-like superfamily)
MERYGTVDAYIESSGAWREALVLLRGVFMECGLEETVKWGGPCYTVDGKNVVGLASFKSYVGIWFFQGALLSDPDRVLMNAQEGTTRAMRQWRFQSIDEIDVSRVRVYVLEAVENQRRGLEIRADRSKPVEVPQVLREALRAHPEAQDAFDRMGKGKQREYAEYIGEARQEATRTKRLEKILPMIVAGVGLNDRYR